MGSRIAIFTCEYPPYPGGIASYTREVARAALRIGHEPVVYSFIDRGKTPPDDGFEVIRLKPDTYSHAKLPLLTLRAAGVLAKRSFDIVLAADLQTLIALAPVATKAAKKAAVHGTDVRSRLLTRFFSSPLWRPLNAYESIFANSNFTRGLVLQTHPYFPAERVVAALLGVGPYWREDIPAESVQTLTGKFGLEPGRFVAASVGRLEPRKGLHQAIAAIAALPDSVRSAVTYLIVGRPVEDAYRARLLSWIASSGADIRLLGEIPETELRAIYHRANLLLHTACRDGERAEGFGLVLLEAASCGLPALATHIDALPEVVMDGQTGFLVEDGAIDAMAGKLRAFIADPQILAALSERCKSFAATFTWDRCARTTFGV